MEKIKLTQFSRGAGCGCKMAPAVLEELLRTDKACPADKKLIVGNESSDDAAVYDLGDGNYLISTTDFFTPVVNDAETFGKIAAANAISDVYAMGGKPVLALAVLGWPVEKIPVEEAKKVLNGARSVCAEAGIVLAGGHSIDSPEPVFGLCVNGMVKAEHLKKNNTACPGDLIFITKPIGTGILTTAEKRGILKPEHEGIAAAEMMKLNKAGTELGKLSFVHAMTDITGFGLLGHLTEMAKGSGLSAEIHYADVPVIPAAKEYAAQFVYPDNTMRNWSFYEKTTEGIGAESLITLCDPQTNGGLMMAIDNQKAEELKKMLTKEELFLIGKFVSEKEKPVYIL